jgi:hypothetical protein
MAIIGFIFCFVALCYFTFALGFSVIGTMALTGTISKGQQLFTLIAAVALGWGWYGLFQNITISVGGL